MDHPANSPSKMARCPRIELKGDASRLRQSGHQHRGQYPPVYAGGLACGDLHGCAPASISPESLSRMPVNEQSLRHLVEAIEVGQSMQSGYELRDCAIQRPRSRRAAGGTVEDLRTFPTPPTRRVRVRRAVRDSAWQSRNPWSRRIMDSSAHRQRRNGLTLTVVLPIAPVEPSRSRLRRAKRIEKTKKESQIKDNNALFRRESRRYRRGRMGAAHLLR